MNDLENHSPLSRVKSSTLWKIRGKSQWALMSSGKVFNSGSLWIRWCQPEEYSHDPVRVGCAISSKYGNAVARNKLKRRVKEVIRKNVVNGEIPLGLFLLVGASKSAKTPLSFIEIEDTISAFISSLK